MNLWLELGGYAFKISWKPLFLNYLFKNCLLSQLRE